MLDTNARKYVQPLIKKFAMIFVKLKMSANQVTVLALLIGLLPAVIFYYFDNAILAVAVLWLSGLLDAVDGTIARITNTSSPFGTIMDLVFDRVVEISLIVCFALKFEPSIVLIILEASIILSMTIFLSVGAASNKKSEKSFHYQAGIAERTEGFIFFSLAMLFPTYLNQILLVFTALILITALQRFFEAKKILS
jgi:CDP-diacylglycerol--glycerol-3-phosphate 3-phosphatidyltransferase